MEQWMLLSTIRFLLQVSLQTDLWNLSSWTCYFRLQFWWSQTRLVKLNSAGLRNKPDKEKKKSHYLRNMGSLSQRQAIISWTLMLSLKFSLMLIPNRSCQLYTWLQVTTAVLARRLCWYGCIDRWMDEKKRKAEGTYRFGNYRAQPRSFFLVLVVYQVVLLRHGCQDLMTERRCQTVDTDWKRNEATNDLWPSPDLFKPPVRHPQPPPAAPPNKNRMDSKSVDLCSVRPRCSHRHRWKITFAACLLFLFKAERKGSVGERGGVAL